MLLSLFLNLSFLNFLKRDLFLLMDFCMPCVIQGFSLFFCCFLLNFLKGACLSSRDLYFSRKWLYAASELFMLISSRAS